MKKTMQMSIKEAESLGIMRQVDKNILIIRKASEELGVSLSPNSADSYVIGGNCKTSCVAQIRAFSVGFGFFAKRLWPKGYVTLRKTKPTKKARIWATQLVLQFPQ